MRVPIEIRLRKFLGRLKWPKWPRTASLDVAMNNSSVQIVGLDKDLFNLEDVIQVTEDKLRKDLLRKDLDVQAATNTRDLLRILKTPPDYLTEEQSTSLVSLLQYQRQTLQEIMGADYYKGKIEQYFNDQGISESTLRQLREPVMPVSSVGINPERVPEIASEIYRRDRLILIAIDRLTNVIKLEATDDLLRIGRFVNGNSASKIARRNIILRSDVTTLLGTDFPDGTSIPSIILNPYTYVVNGTMPLDGLSPLDLFKQDELWDNNIFFNRKTMKVDLRAMLTALGVSPDFDDTEGTEPNSKHLIERNIQRSVLGQQIVRAKIADGVQRTYESINAAVEPALIINCHTEHGAYFLRLIQNLYGAIHDDDIDYYYDEFRNFVLSELRLDQSLEAMETAAKYDPSRSRTIENRYFLANILDSLPSSERQMVLCRAFSKHVMFLAKKPNVFVHSVDESGIGARIITKKREVFEDPRVFSEMVKHPDLAFPRRYPAGPAGTPQNPNNDEKRKFNVFDRFGIICRIWAKTFESGILPQIIRLVQLDIMGKRIQTYLEDFQLERERLGQVSEATQSEMIDFLRARDELRTRFAFKVLMAYEDCLSDTKQLLEARRIGSENVPVREDIKKRLENNANQFNAIIAKASARFFSPEECAKTFPLDFSNGGLKVTIVNQDERNLPWVKRKTNRLYMEIQKLHECRDGGCSEDNGYIVGLTGEPNE